LAPSRKCWMGFVARDHHLISLLIGGDPPGRTATRECHSMVPDGHHHEKLGSRHSP
jgi:hypothetical protein